MCVLHVSSKDSLAGFLAVTALPVYQSHEKGDMKHKRKGTRYDDWGFSCDVSTREWSDFCGQTEDAIGFLKLHSAELHSLISKHPIDDIRLDFPVESQLSEDVLFQFHYLPPEIIRLCAQHGIGIEVSHHAPGQHDNCEPSDAPLCDGPATSVEDSDASGRGRHR